MGKICAILGKEEGGIGAEWPMVCLKCPITGFPTSSQHYKGMGDYWQQEISCKADTSVPLSRI